MLAAQISKEKKPIGEFLLVTVGKEKPKWESVKKIKNWVYLLRVKIAYGSLDGAWNMCELIWGEFRESKVGYFGHHLVSEEDVTAFHIPVDNSWTATSVQILQSWRVTPHAQNWTTVESLAISAQDQQQSTK